MEGDGSGVTNLDKTRYSVETEDTSLATLLPTFHDLELINQTHGDLRSGLYDVLAAENATEVITIGRVTQELERRPRDNAEDGLEPLEGAYKRLEAQYGGWESGAKGWRAGWVMVVTVSYLLLL